MSISEITTPKYVINLAQVQKNYCDFIQSLNSNGDKNIVAYSIKANYDKRIIDILNKEGAYFEICSELEAKILTKQKVNPEKIIVNKIYNTVEELESFLLSNYIVILDSFEQLNLLKFLKQECYIGLRINLDFIKNNNPHFFCKKSRFGLDPLNQKVIFFLQNNSHIHVRYLHCHFSGNTRAPLIYTASINELYKLTLLDVYSEVQFLDIGGGFKIDSKYWNVKNVMPNRNLD